MQLWLWWNYQPITEQENQNEHKMFNVDSSGFFFFTAMISSEFIDFSLGFCTKQDWKEGKGGKKVSFTEKNKHKHIPSQQSNYKP